MTDRIKRVTKRRKRNMETSMTLVWLLVSLGLFSASMGAGIVGAGIIILAFLFGFGMLALEV